MPFFLIYKYCFLLIKKKKKRFFPKMLTKRGKKNNLIGTHNFQVALTRKAASPPRVQERIESFNEELSIP